MGNRPFTGGTSENSTFVVYWRVMPRLLPVILFLSCWRLPAMAQLQVDFAMDKAGGCGPLVVQFTPIVRGGAGALNYYWDLGNGNTATIANPQAIYTRPGAYTVTLTVNQSVSATHTVNVYGPPTANISIPVTKVCGTPVSFTGNTDGGNGGGIVGWLWDFADGTTASNGPTVNHSYAQGMGSVSLTVTDVNGCTATETETGVVTVLAPVSPGFTADKSVLCNVTDPVQFGNTSTGPGTLAYTWDFGDGTNSAAISPSHSYSAKGSYTVKLTATSSEGCSASFTQTTALNVANYSTDFSIPATGVCTGTPVTFTDNSSLFANSRTWQVDGAAAGYYDPFQYTFTTGGAHTVTLSNLFGGCPQSVTKTVTINAAPATTPFTVTTIQNCTGYDALFSAVTPGGVTWAWDAQWSYLTQPYDFIGSPTGSTFSNKGYSYNYPYVAAMMVTNAAGCTSLVTVPVEIDRPEARITEVSGNRSSCNQPVTMTYGVSYSGTIQSYHWDFGDGTTSTSPSPTHTFTAPGEYNIQLSYVDASGCTRVAANGASVLISPPLNLDFTTTTPVVCAGSTVWFESPSLTAANPLYSSWDFSDGSISSFYPYHQFNTPGTYSVTLNAENGGGCTATVTKTNYITVVPPPGSYQGHTNTCDNNRDIVTFGYASTSATSLVWDFGDGQNATTDGTVAQVQHTYAKTGTYYINLTVSNAQCSVQNSDVVYVLKKQQPQLTADASSVCAGGVLNVRLAIDRDPMEINSGYDYDYTPRFFYADGTPFGGSVTFTNPLQPYSNGTFGWTLSGFQPGESGLSVTTTSFGLGCTDVSNTIPLTIRGSAAPALTVVSDDHCYQQAVVLQDASSVGPNNSIVSRMWDFGDGTTLSSATGGTASHVYTDPGSYAVRLTVQDAGGCSVTSGAGAAFVSVNGPKAAFSTSGSPILLGNTLYFYNTTNMYGVGVVGYTWDFGDGTSSNAFGPSHLYTAPGVYTVTLTASDGAGGCSSVAVATVVVQNFNSHFQVSGRYVTNGQCPPVVASFTNTSAGYSSVSWDFGDGITAGNVINPTHVYAQPGTYIVTLYAYGSGGLIGQWIDSVVVRQPSATLEAAVTTLCAGEPVSLKASASGASRFVFDFGDGTVSGGGDSSISHVYAAEGSYDACLVVVDTVGCSVAAADAVGVVVEPAPLVHITPVKPVVCMGGSLALNATGGVSYSWFPPTGLDRADVASPVASPDASTLYTVTAVDGNGCQGALSVNVVVQGPEKVTVSPDSTSVCAGGSVSLQASGTDRYSWVGDGIDAAGLGSVVVKPLVSTHYRVVGSDSSGCFSDTAVVAVTVLPLPTVNAGADVEVLQGEPVTLTASGSPDIVGWQWSPGDYLSCTDCAQPVCTPLQPETYVVKAVNAVGCSVGDTVVVKLICDELHVRIPEAFTPNGDGHNDRFVILGIGEVDHLVIYDRWGVKVFERDHFYTADRSAQWDGMVGGQQAPAGVYAYFVEMRCPVGGRFTKRGTVVLVR